MGTKVITTTNEQTIHVCDRCAHRIISWQDCKICNREVGHCCSRRVLVYTPGQTVVIDGGGFYVCKDCDEAGKDVVGTSFINLIRDKVKEADAYALAILDRWREWAKMRREKGGAT